MNEKKQLLSPVYKRRFHIQGYDIYTDQEIYNHKYGIRFAYLGCGILGRITKLNTTIEKYRGKIRSTRRA